ncbi:serine/threonine-protein kinase [Sphingomonas sp. LHG3406-1]|uniref:serine/threonine protein kinase n=1 Tax=Sphingomonas sp. LHG3406-1 TaxID=2804617 RepID=UPI00260A46DE|nr:serine/threonine-protein kinase [Sphingomonas sp. LHG3406-1]
MNKAYSTKALPPGTVLREWRLEEVLGVGGFGIVYKGRGIYFNELVAIKEYFPSSISERDAEATVVPIDSNAEEVHALGLKKFVEEAKLLWNLSTPSRHPNIVSVRSLFEIHGTAYMVMDFEDGVSLSRLIKQGQKWNERSLVALVKPIAEGLDRAHRVGVLHRDIKPPNILINDSGKPVLIDFGSARFEAAEATSTKVTFHTPPYAAIEQYVKTFEQGPWTDIYAIGVVLYECVTGTKPPEVLERMHGGAGEALADGVWPGYSRNFLKAVDAAMMVRPADRPQSIAAWLEMLEAPADPDEDDIADVTRIVPFDTSSEAIVPIAPVASGNAQRPIETGVPDRPSQAEFKRAGHTKASKKSAEAAAPQTGETPASPATPTARSAAKAPERDRKAEAQAASLASSPSAEPTRIGLSKPLLAGGVALALAAVAAVGFGLRGDDTPPTAENGAIDVSAPTRTAAAAPVPVADLASGMNSLAEEASAAKVPDSLLEPVTALAGELSATPAPEETQANDRTRAAAAALAAGLVTSVEERSTQLSSRIAWSNADPATLPNDRRAAVTNLQASLAEVRGTAERARSATSAADALAQARATVAHYRSYSGAAEAIAALHSGDEKRLAELADASRKAALPKQPSAGTLPPRVVTGGQAPAATAVPVTTASSDVLSQATTSQFNGLVNEGRGMARDVIRMGERASPGSTPEQRAAYDLLRSNAQLARTYDASLAGLKDSFRGIRSDRQADPLIKQARQTRAYLVFLVKRSTDASKR